MGGNPSDFFTAPPAFAPPRAYNWTGVYIGINAGGGWGNPHWDTSPWPSTLMDGNYSLSGGLFGGTLGYNLQAGTSSFVIGGEVDLAAANIKGRTPSFCCPGRQLSVGRASNCHADAGLPRRIAR